MIGGDSCFSQRHRGAIGLDARCYYRKVRDSVLSRVHVRVVAVSLFFYFCLQSLKKRDFFKMQKRCFLVDALLLVVGNAKVGNIK